MERSKNRPGPSQIAEVPFGSNEVRLSVRGWLVTIGILALLFGAIPWLWEGIEPFDPQADYRVPYRLSSDYWMIRRYLRRVAQDDGIPVLGDSVVWGHYVARDQTLTHYLNTMTHGRRFVNVGIDGIHPAAMAGLVRYYGRALRDRRIVVHCNLLWTASPRHDLTTAKETAFNHPKLVPQFYPRVPCYRESFSRRLGIVVGRHVPLFAWADHLRIAYFDDMDLASWSIEHPYANPLGAVTLRLPSPDEPPQPEPVARPWREQGIRPFGPPWVRLEDSLQWRLFRRTIRTLRQRGNRLFVLVGPFNEHMLTPSSRAAYRQRKRAVAAWLRSQRIPHFAPDPLPSDDYADASHPLASGYRRLAQQLLAAPAFAAFSN